jgi:hypothetical protein
MIVIRYSRPVTTHPAIAGNFRIAEEIAMHTVVQVKPCECKYRHVMTFVLNDGTEVCADTIFPPALHWDYPLYQWLPC